MTSFTGFTLQQRRRMNDIIRRNRQRTLDLTEPVFPESQAQIAAVESGALPGYAATSPAARRRAQELARNPKRPVVNLPQGNPELAQRNLALSRRVGEADDQYIRRLRDSGFDEKAIFNARQSNPFIARKSPEEISKGLEASRAKQSADEAKRRAYLKQRYGLDDPTKPLSQLLTMIPEARRRAQRGGETGTLNRLQFERFLTNQALGTISSPKNPRGQTSGPMQVDFASDEMFDSTGVFSPQRLGVDIGDGDMFRTADGATMRWDEQAGVATAMVWNPARANFEPRDAALARRAQRDPAFRRELATLDAERAQIPLAPGLSMEERAKLFANNESRRNALARVPQSEVEDGGQELQREFEATTLPVEGSANRVYQKPDGTWEKLELEDNEEAKAKQTYIKAWIDMNKAMQQKDIMGNTKMPDPNEVTKMLETALEAANRKFAPGVGSEQPAASQPQSTGKKIWVTNGKEVREIDESDLHDAIQDGYRQAGK